MSIKWGHVLPLLLTQVVAPDASDCPKGCHTPHMTHHRRQPGPARSTGSNFLLESLLPWRMRVRGGEIGLTGGHVLEDLEELAALLTGKPGLRLLVTSRECRS